MYEGKYYYVPKSSADRFFKLFVETTLLYDPPTDAKNLKAFLGQIDQLRMNELFGR